MDTEKDDMELGRLFREKLENAEIIPDPSVSVRLMRKVAWRKFLTFNPASLNIYYVTGLVAAGITAAFLLTSNKEASYGLSEKSLYQIPVNVHESVDSIAFKPEPLKSKNNSKLQRSAADKLELKTRITSVVRNEEPEVKSVISEIDHDNIITPGLKGDILKIDTGTDKLISNSQNTGNIFVSSVNKGCMPLKVRFVTTVTDADSYRWIFGDGGSSNDMNPEWIFDVDGEYRVILEVYRSGKLVGQSSETIKVYPRPDANFEFTPENAVIPDEEVRFINYSREAVKYLWDFGDGSSSELFEPQHKYSEYKAYNVRLTVLNAFGCEDSAIVHNAFEGSKYFIEFPNAFIPNTGGPTGGIYSSKSDEMAQIFHPSFSGVSEYQLKIFSKMGIVIFESNDINIGWDGYFKGQLSNAGVYIWKVRGKYRNGEPFTKMGDVTLLKNQ